MAFYGKVLQDSIEAEKRGEGYPYSHEDRAVLDEMFAEINRFAGTGFHYLAELDTFNICGSGPIIAKYVWQIQSQMARAVLIQQMVSDRIKDCGRQVLDLYLDFKASDSCTLDPEIDQTFAIYVRFDNAFWRLKPKRLKYELLELARNPQDAFRLPFTMRTLASWKMPEMYDILIQYSDGVCVTAEMLGFPADTEARQRRLAVVNENLRFTAINGLKYFPTPEVERLICALTENPDEDIASAAKKTLATIEKKKAK